MVFKIQFSELDEIIAYTRHLFVQIGLTLKSLTSAEGYVRIYFLKLGFALCENWRLEARNGLDARLVASGGEEMAFILVSKLGFYYFCFL